jgi:hypothetical protein
MIDKDFIIGSLFYAWNVFLVIIGVMSFLVLVAMFLSWQTPEVTDEKISDFNFFMRFVFLVSLITGVCIKIAERKKQ